MRTADFLEVLYGRRDEVREVYPSFAAAKLARQRASTLLRAVKDRHFMGVVKEGAPPIHRLNDTGVYVDPQQPNVLVCAFAKRPLKASMYDPVLALAVGQSCELRIRAEPESLHAKLRLMAGEVEQEIGTRPAWQAELLADPQGRMFKTYRVTRLPDDYDPKTAAPREQPTGARLEAKKAAWLRMGQLEEAYLDARADAVRFGGPMPQIPQELIDLATRWRPETLRELQEASV